MNQKTITFVIPLYNEEKRINKTFQALKNYSPIPGIKLEKVIFVNDGSTDKTKSLLKRRLNVPVEVISYKVNQGKGYAVKQGMLSSTSDYALFFDCDMSTPLTELKKFIPEIKKGYEVIIGTRKNGHSTVIKHQPLYRELLGRGFTLISNLILSTSVTDFTCGFKVFSRKSALDVFSRAKINRWGYDAEAVFLTRKLDYSLKEVPVKWSNDDSSKVNLLKDIPETLIDLIKIRLSHSILNASLSGQLLKRMLSIQN